MARLIRWSGNRIMSLALLKIASVFLIWLSAMKICGIILETPSYKTIHPNHKKSFRRITKQMILYQSMEPIFYYLVLVVDGWW